MRKCSIIQFGKTHVCPLGDDKHLIRTEYRERCFIYQSFGCEESSFGDVIIRPFVTFLADSGDGTAAEWEPQYGPIQLWTECSEDWRGETELGSPISPRKPRKHWHFPFVENAESWSQLAVDREGLKGKLRTGDLDGVFDVLSRWAEL